MSYTFTYQPVVGHLSSPLIWIQGDVGQHKLTEFKKVEDAIKDFEKKFKDKTKNNWSDRENFIPHKGKYTLIEVDGEQDTEVKVNAHFIQTKTPKASALVVVRCLCKADQSACPLLNTEHLIVSWSSGLTTLFQADVVDSKTVNKNTLPCTLDKPTQNLIELIFSQDMFKEAMECMNLGGCVWPLPNTPVQTGWQPVKAEHALTACSASGGFYCLGFIPRVVFNWGSQIVRCVNG